MEDNDERHFKNYPGLSELWEWGFRGLAIFLVLGAIFSLFGGLSYCDFTTAVPFC